MNSFYQPLHHKYRPQKLSELVGQEAIAATLGNALRTGRIAPAYLFSGPRGTGKTSSARILARSLNCIGSEGPTPEPCGVCELCTSIAAGNALDVIEIDAASNTGVDNIRELIERSRFAPVQARWKVYVVDECHMLSTAAFNALLKTLEEPPPRVVFVLATTDPQRVLPTILSRCQRFDFRRIPLEALERHLAWIAEQEAIGITPDALRLVAQRAQGGLRDAESLLDQLSLLPPPVETEAVWELLGAVPEQELLQLARAMAAGEPLGVVESCRDLMDRGREAGAVLQGLASLLRDLLVAGVAPDRLELTSVSPSLRTELPEVARGIGKARLLHWQAQLKGSEQQLRHSVQPRLWLEVLLLGLLAEAPNVATRAGSERSNVPTGPAPTITASAASGRPSGTVSTPTPDAASRPATPGSSAPSIPAETQAAPSRTRANPTPVATLAGSAPTPGTPASAAAASADLTELWQQILAGLELPSTRMLLSQQAHLHRLDQQRAVVRVAGSWIPMVQSRLPLLEAAMARALGSPRQVTLEAGQQNPAPPAAPPPPAPASTPVREEPPAAQASTAPAPVAPPPAIKPPLPSASEAAAVAAAVPPPKPAQGGPAPTLPTMPAPVSTETEPATPAPASKPERGIATRLEQQTRLLADFFNGEVIETGEEANP
ncbi:MAG: DNA polymerase III subunit gamma/tau [Cyanobium sp.]